MLISSSVKVSEAEARAALARMPKEEGKKLEKDPAALKEAVTREEGKAVVQAWLNGVNSG